MAKFTDTEGREWIVRLDVNRARELRARAGYDVFGPPASVATVIDNPEALVDALFVACEAQARERGIDGAAFASGLAGDVIDSATAALMEAVVDFFPSRRRAALRAVLRQTEAVLTHAMEQATQAIESVTPAEILAKAGERSTSSPASSESIHAR